MYKPQDMRFLDFGSAPDRRRDKRHWIFNAVIMDEATNVDPNVA